MTEIFIKGFVALSWAGYMEVRYTRGALRRRDKAPLIAGSVAVLGLVVSKSTTA